MGLFSFLFSQPVFISDAVFSRLGQEYLAKRTGKAWFVTEDLLFAPTGQTIGCYIDADATGPTSAQQAFYQYIEQHYTELIPKLIPIIEVEFHNWGFPLRILDFAAEFQLTSVSIPEISSPPTRPIEWDWSFDTIHDADHMLTIYMSGDLPLPGVQFDG